MRQLLRSLVVLLLGSVLLLGPAATVLPSAAAATSVAAPRPAAAPAVFGSGQYQATSISDPSYGFNGALSGVFDGAHVWVANQGGNSLTELNASDRSLVRVVSGATYDFDHPWTTAFDGSHIWVTNPDNNTVTEVNASDGSLVRVLSGGSYGFNAPRGIAFDFATDHLWVTDEFGNSLTEIRGTDGAFVALVNATALQLNHPNTILDDGTHLWVTNINGNSVTELNPDGTWVRTLSGGSYGFQQPSGLAFVDGHLWVSSWSLSAPAVTEVNGDDGGLIAYVPMPAPRPVGIVAFDGYLWVALWEGSSLVQIQESNAAIVHTFGPADGPFNYPQGIVSDGNELWVINAGGNSVVEVGDPSPSRPTVVEQSDDGVANRSTENVSALVSGNGLPTSYHVEWGSTQGRYDHIGPTLPTGSLLNEPRPTRVAMQLTGLSLLQIVHWRVVATNGRGTHVGVDQATTFFWTFGTTTSPPPYCNKHLQWKPITADIIGPGCWNLYQPKLWPENSKLAIPLPVPYGQSETCAVFLQTCPPPPPLKGIPPLYLTGDNELIARASGPVMMAVGDTAGAPVTVELNGLLITSTHVIADQPSGEVQATDASIDLAGADGVPPTPLARHTRILTRVPSNQGPPLVGPGSGATRHLLASPLDGGQLSCQKPTVSNAALLGNFPDPTGLASSLGGLSLGGSGITAHLIDGMVVVCVDITLPVGTCDADSDFAVQATLVADQNGLTLQDLYAHLGCAVIAGVVFSDVSFSFTNQNKKWVAAGTVEAIPGLPMSGAIQFEHGAFSRADVSVDPQYLTLGFLRLKHAGLTVTPTSTSGQVGFGSVISVPYTTLDPLSIDGQYTYNWGASPPFFDASGNVSVFGGQVADADVKVYGGDHPRVTGHARFEAGIDGVFTAQATVSVDYLNASQWNVDGEGSATAFDYISIGGEVVASDNGAGVCIDGSDFGLGHFGLVVHSSGSVSAWLPVEGGCDISGARDVLPPPPAGARAGLRATASTLSVRVDPAPGVFFGVRGADGPPAVTLIDPQGGLHVVPAAGSSLGSAGAVFHDVANGITYVGIRQPAAGTWRVVAADGAALTELRTGVLQGPAKVAAAVVRTGSSYALRYRGPKVRGQSVAFVERGANGLRLLATVKGGGNGSVKVAPVPGSSAPRVIEAMVSQNGLPRTEIKAGSYRTPQVKAPRSAPRARVARTGTSLVVTWPTLAGADHYLTTVRTSDGRARVFFGTRTKVVLGGVDRSAAATVTVRGVAAGLRGKAITLRLGTPSLSLSKVVLGPTVVAKKAKVEAVTLTANRGATVSLSLRSLASTGKALVSITRAAKAGRNAYLLPLTVKGKRLRAGRYLVLMVATTRGLPAVRRSWVVTLR
ncbi:hypothetical protein acdb102_00420 [Acidothermaceae bacterium B102]|nr:hypothetical protein acdb102_00420 [Acidothermaceae bacterium B102]